uniref:E3 ubiquitin-protein ligase HUWE1 isoform X5 n=1 Tax=Myxine glutinosa TaxID=7769 RepID=UPI00358F3842
MKVDRTKLKKTPTEAPSDCRALIEKLKLCTDMQLLQELQQIKTWNFGKCELYHWVDLLDHFDGILAEACGASEGTSWLLVCDLPQHESLKALLLAVLNFTALLIEYSFSRHLYSSIEHLTTLLASSDMQVVLAVLNLLYVFSKRSNYITRLNSEKRAPLLSRLQHLAESWGGKENGFGLAECCQDLPLSKFPLSATTLHFEFYTEIGPEGKTDKKASPNNTLHYIHIEQLDKISEIPSEIMESLTKMYSIPKDKQMLLFTHVRLAHGFSNHKKRLQAVQARLHAISILVYSNALQESTNSILYNGLIEELVDVLQIPGNQLMDIKAASLRTLTSIVHLERTPKPSSIIDCTGVASYHGFLPVLVRNCIQAMIDPSLEPFPHQFATALFSFLYHLASYDAGGEALVSCGMMEALLKVIKFLGDEQDQITFVTRAVRVVDLITNLDMAAFQLHGGLSCFVNRLEHEVKLCRKECPFVVKPRIRTVSGALDGEEMETESEATEVAMEASPGSSSVTEGDGKPVVAAAPPKPGAQCIPQRAALLKSMLNFLKKAIPDPAFSDSIRRVMDQSLPTSLKHIISNAEYYGPSLFLLATEVVTVFVFQEPSLLSSLQDNGLTDVMLHALLIKDVPATREVLGSLPNVFSALCLNARGLQSFVRCQPFERLFKVLLSPDYLPAMRRRRSSDPLGDTASNLGSAVDELMRHQPSLKTDATSAIIKLLEEICSLGREPKYVCQRPSIQKVEGPVGTPTTRPNHAAEEASSEDEEEEELSAMQSFNGGTQASVPETETHPQSTGNEERIPIPLMDYILNVMKFVESILSNNTTDDHCQEFVTQKGLVPLLSILGLPNLPIDFPSSAACQAVAGVCKSILTLSHEPKVLKEGLVQLHVVLDVLESLHRPVEAPGGSVLLRELAQAGGGVADATLSAQATPLLHALSAAHAYIMVFVHTCRVGQSDIRSISVNQWGSQMGLAVLNKLSQLYCSLVWESTVLLSLCTPNSLPVGCEFGQADMQKLMPKEDPKPSSSAGPSTSIAAPSVPVTAIPVAISSTKNKTDGEALASMEASVRSLMAGPVGPLRLEVDPDAPMETDEAVTGAGKGNKSKVSATMPAHIKQIKPLLSASSKLGRALAELFGLLVKLCVGSPVRRRSHHPATSTTAPSPAARATATALARLLSKGLSWTPPSYTPTPRFRLTFFICAVGFTSPMLFEERKYPYYLMLQKFLTSGGHSALFETFNWALSMSARVPVPEGQETPDLPDGTGEFLDAWLLLVEKMVHPATVLESPHTLPSRPGSGSPAFSPSRFLILTQKAAFEAIMNLWNRRPLKVYGSRMAESMLAILCHILRGETIIREQLSKERDGSRDEEAPPPAPEDVGGGTAGVNGVTGSAGSVSNGNSSAVALASGSAASVATTGGASSVPAAASSTTDSSSSSSSSGGGGASSTVGGGTAGSTAGTVGTPSHRREPDVNQQQLQQLVDMGFSREQAVEALLHTSTMEQATEYLITHPPPLLGGTDLHMSEEDQMIRAIAMSLGQDICMEQGAESPEDAERRREEEERRSREKQEEDEARLLETMLAIEPLEPSVLQHFTEDMMPSCLHLLDALPDTVYSVRDLLMTAIRRNGSDFQDDVLHQVVEQVWGAANVLIKAAVPLTTSDSKTLLEWTSQMATLPQASNLATRILLLTLLFEELKLPCARIVESSGILDVLIKLLEVAQPCLLAARDQKEPCTPKWITPLLLLIDFYEKMSVASKRRSRMNKYLQPSGNNWRWFDDRSGRWCTYSSGNNSTIDTAWRAGESSVRFTAGRRRYTVVFNTTVQINEETGNRRPVMLSLLRLPRKESAPKALPPVQDSMQSSDVPEPENKARQEKDASTAVEAVQAEAETDSSLGGSTATPVVVRGLTEEQCRVLVRACVSMLGVPVDPYTLHGTLRLCLRLTRDHNTALLFAELGGTRLLLSLTQAARFTGFLPLATLIFRHVLEEPGTLWHTMEKVVRSAVTSGAGSTTSGVVSGSLGTREMHYILRVLGPAACRHPDIFVEVAKSCMRIALPAPRGNGSASDDDAENLRIKGPNAVQLLKTTPVKPAPQPQVSDAIRDVLHDLLNALAALHVTDEGEKQDNKAGGTGNMTQELSHLLRDLGDDIDQQFRTGPLASTDYEQPTSFGLNALVFSSEGNSMDGTQTGAAQAEGATSSEDKESGKDRGADQGGEELKAKAKALAAPLMTKSAILRLLAELVRSYAGCASLIVAYNYTAGQSPLVKEECSMLAFVLDCLLPQTQVVGDKDSPALARLFLASVAAANQCTDAQLALVTEVKAALGRALALPESTEKHARLQAVVCIISTIMESCPTSPTFCSGPVIKAQQNGVNNMIRLFLKKGLVSDLARVPHSLDLSSPNMANTVNAALKPLETLSRIVNQPSSLFGGKSTGNKGKNEAEAGSNAADPNSNTQELAGDPSEAEAQEEETGPVVSADADLMEAETDADVEEGITGARANHRQEMQVENELEDLIGELLDRDDMNNVTPEILAEACIIRRGQTDADHVPEHDAQEDVLMDVAPSTQASARSSTRQDPEDEDNTQEEEEDSSGSNDDDDDDDSHVGEEDEDEQVRLDQDEEGEEEGEEEEDEDEEEGSEIELDEEMHDVSETLFRYDQDDDLVIEFDTMFSSGADIPPAPGTVPSTHPLMVRQTEHAGLGPTSSTPSRLVGGAGVCRNQRGARSFGGSAGHTIHLHYPVNRQHNAPLILQRLLGPSAAADILQLSSSLPMQGRGRTRLLVGNDDVHIISHNEEDLLEDFFQEQTNATCQSGTLASIPTALSRWMEECRVLDGENTHDCVAVVKLPIIQQLEAIRDEELEERREKRRQQIAEEEARKAEAKSREEQESDSTQIVDVSVSSSNSTVGPRLETTMAHLEEPSSEDMTSAPVSSDGTISLTPEARTPLTPDTADDRGPAAPLQPDIQVTNSEPANASTVRPACDEALQMEMSPAHTISSEASERTEASDILTGVSSQPDGSPMDVSSPASVVGTVDESQGTAQAMAPLASNREDLTAVPGQAAGLLAALNTEEEILGVFYPAVAEGQSNIELKDGADVEEPQDTLPSPGHGEDPLAGISLPDGVDPSFLAALPEDIRQEVLQNQLGIRPPARSPGSAGTSGASAAAAAAAAAAASATTPQSVTEVNPEFLAALPPSIQEEVLAQQRAEQQRREMAQNPNPEAPVDPVTFIQTLPSALRQSVLADMDDSLLAVLPPDIAAEAQTLRRELEARHRQLMQERLFSHSNSSALSAILRSTGLSGRLGANRGVQYTRLTMTRSGGFQWGTTNQNRTSSGGGGGSGSGGGGSGGTDGWLKLRGRQLLDHEALSCLLVLLFVDEPKLNTSRLHRVLRNLCYHPPTRSWVIRSLLSILQRGSESELCVEGPRPLPEEKGKRKASGSSGHELQGLEMLHRTDSRPAISASTGQLSWLSVSMDAALGCRTNIFQIQRAAAAAVGAGGGGVICGAGGSGSCVGASGSTSSSATRKHWEKHSAMGAGTAVHIHPQAAPVVCRHVLDTLIQLAKVFPGHFTQVKPKETCAMANETERDVHDKLGKVTCYSSAVTAVTQSLNLATALPFAGPGGISTDFWDLLVKLDNMNVSRKGKASVHRGTTPLGLPESEGAQNSLETSPLGQLLNMLANSVIRRSPLLTEKLLRLLSLVSIALPDSGKATNGATTNTTSSTTTTTSTTAPVSSTAVGSSSVNMVLASKAGDVTPFVEPVAAPAGLMERQLQLAVEVLTSHSCSEESLEDAANLLLQLSRGEHATRDTVLRLLLNGARQLGQTVCQQIGMLLAELREYNLEQAKKGMDDSPATDLSGSDEHLHGAKVRGHMVSRFDLSENVVIVASNKRSIAARELQLPSMSLLTSKTSSQKFFLRVLQVIIQLRDAARRANKKAKPATRQGSGTAACSIQAAVRQLEAEADAIMQLVREGRRQLQQPALGGEAAQSESTTRQDESPMEVDQPSPASQDAQPLGANQTEADTAGTTGTAETAAEGEEEEEDEEEEEEDDHATQLPRLSVQLDLEELWNMLGDCLKELAESHDHHAVLVLQPAVEAFFIVHATERETKPPVRDTRESQLAHIRDEAPPLSPAPVTPASPSVSDPFFARENSTMHISSSLPPDTQKFLRFAETHRTVLNQILRQATMHLADGPFAVLVDHIRVLDFDIKRRYFRQELERMDEGIRREDLAVHVRRDHVFEDSYRELHRRTPEELKNRLYIVFEGEEGQDAGGLLREWYTIISREMFNPMYALFRTSPGDRVTYTINPSSHFNSNHLSYFKFVGRIVAKAVYDNRLLECYFTRSFYKHILGKPVRYTDMESEDYPFYQGLVYLLENDVSTLGYDLPFSTEVEEFGVCEVRDLKTNGRNVTVTEDNKREYVHLVCQMKMTGAIRKQLAAFLEGFYEIIPKRLISIFTEQELELLISGLPIIDIDDLKANTEYHKYQPNSLQIQWFWRALRSFDQAERAKFLQFVTGTSKVPLQGFAALEGMNGIQKFQIHRDDRSTDRLPSAHTCFNQLDLPAYETHDKLRRMLLLAIQECSEGFGLA